MVKYVFMNKFLSQFITTTIFASDNALKLNYKHFFRVFTMFSERNLKEDRFRVRNS